MIPAPPKQDQASATQASSSAKSAAPTGPGADLGAEVMSATTRSIVVGVDGSDGAAHALEWVATFAADLGAQVTAVHALGLLEHLGQYSVPAWSHRDEILQLLENQWTLPLKGVPHRCTVVDGNPVTALIAAAEDEGAELIVVGRRGSGGYPDLLLGSTSEALVQQALRPVVVVPPREVSL